MESMPTTAAASEIPAAATPRSSNSSGGSTVCAGSPSGMLRHSMRLAVEGASTHYISVAEGILSGSAAAQQLRAAAAAPGFAQAVLNQGLVLDELAPSSKLSLARRTELLAAVLQECDESQSVVSHTSPKARFFKDATEQKHVAALQLRERMNDQIQAVKERHDEIKQADFAAKEDKMQAKADKSQRFQASREVAAVERKVQAQVNQEAYHQTVEQGQKLLAERIAEKETRNTTRDEADARTAAQARDTLEAQVRERQQALQEQMQGAAERNRQTTEDARMAWEQKINAKEEQVNRFFERKADGHQEQKEKMQQRFERVQEQAEAAKNLDGERREQMESRHAAAMERSQGLLQVCREHEQVCIDSRREHRAERDHQVLRVARIQQNQRFTKLEEIEEDMAIFKDVPRTLQERQQRENWERVSHGPGSPTMSPSVSGRASQDASPSKAGAGKAAGQVLKASEDQQLVELEQKLQQLKEREKVDMLAIGVAAA